MGMTPGPLVRALFTFDLTNPLVVLETRLVVLTNILVVSMAWGLGFWSRQKSIKLVKFFNWSCLYQKYSSPKAVDSQIYFGAQNPDFPS